MKTLLLCSLLVIASVGASSIQDMPTVEPTPEHKWLKQLVGEWEVKFETTMAPGAEPMRMESTEKMRAIGDLWVLGEGSMNFGGTPHTTLLTIGYDPAQKAFVGTWVDTMQTHLWVYRGSLDEAKKKLTLAAEGPAFGDVTKTAKYHDVIELVNADHKVLTSSILGDDGKWTTFMRADYRRKK
jgi:hypothetical protein